MDMSVPGPTMAQSHRPKNTSMNTEPTATSSVSVHIFTLLKSRPLNLAMASGKPSPASMSESQRTSRAMPKASTAPPSSSSASRRGRPMAGGKSKGTCMKPVSHMVRSV